MEVQNIRFEKLKVSTTNPRFINVVIDELQAILQLVDQDIDKMKNLLSDIERCGFLPIPFYVFINEKETIIMDGNRRLSALRLIKDPNILPNSKKYDELKDMISRINIQIPAEIPCIVFREDNGQLWDTLLKLHISDESKLIWSPLAQYTMSKKLGGNKYKYMSTLLHYFNVDDVEKMTLDNADAFSRLFTAIRTRGVKIEDNGVILLNQENENTIKNRLQQLIELITTKALNTRSPQSLYEKKVEQLLLCKDDVEGGLNLKLQVTPNVFYNGQMVELKNLTFSIINSKEKNKIVNSDFKSITFVSPENVEMDRIDTSIEGMWKIKVEYLGELLSSDILVKEKVHPCIQFVNMSSGSIQIGESRDLRDFILSANNSYNQDVIKKISITANRKNNYTADIVNTTFTGNNRKGIYEICYQFEDVDGSPVSKIYQIEVGDFSKKNVTAVTSLPSPLTFDTSVNINIEPVVNDLINEIQSLNFFNHQSVISCSIRSLLELTLDELGRRSYIKPNTNLFKRLEDLVNHLKTVGANVIVKKSLCYKSFNGLINILNAIDISKINAVVNLGAHKSKKLLNQTTFEETINKDIVQLLNIINEYIN